MKLKKFENGKYQIWNDNFSEVLDPSSLTWHPSYQSQPDFMFIKDESTAKELAEKLRQKESVIEIKDI